MAQYLLHPKHPLRTFVYIVLALGLVVGGFVTLKASQTSTEGRSKAAEEWTPGADFNYDFGFGVQNWLGDDVKVQYKKWGKEANDIYQGVISGKLDVQNYKDYNNGDGYVELTGKSKVKRETTGITIGGLDITYPKGSKEIRVRMSLTPAKGNKIDDCCVFEIYQGNKKIASEKFEVKDDGQIREVKFKIGYIGDIKVSKANLRLKGLKLGDTVKIDYIHSFFKSLK